MVITLVTSPYSAIILIPAFSELRVHKKKGASTQIAGRAKRTVSVSPNAFVVSSTEQFDLIFDRCWHVICHQLHGNH